MVQVTANFISFQFKTSSECWAKCCRLGSCHQLLIDAKKSGMFRCSSHNRVEVMLLITYLSISLLLRLAMLYAKCYLCLQLIIWVASVICYTLEKFTESVTQGEGWVTIFEQNPVVQLSQVAWYFFKQPVCSLCNKWKTLIFFFFFYFLKDCYVSGLRGRRKYC